MPMVVRTNTMASNAYRQLGMNNTALSKSIAKLSSGFQINSASDDASGLAISEKMKAQISDLDQASSNSQDGISLVQTAEGALTEVHSMLNRMSELATKSANGTLQDDVDRDSIQTEVNALNTEISRISKSTNFNGIQLLDGTLSATKAVDLTAAKVNGTVVAPTAVPASSSTYETTAAVAAGSDGVSQTLTVKYTDADGKAQSKDVSYTSSLTAATNAAAIADAIRNDSTLGALFTVSGDTGSAKLSITSIATGAAAPAVTSLSTDDGTCASLAGTSTVGADATTVITPTTNFDAGDTFTINDKTYEFVANAGDAVTTTGATAITLGSALSDSVNNINVALEDDGIVAKDDGSGNISFSAAKTGTGNGLVLQVGATNDDYNKVMVSIDDLSAEGLATANLDVSSAKAAGAAIQTITDAINKVSTNRGNLGALQNRLDHAINNLDTTSENLSSANSRIRDTDMAKEMMSYTQNNVLSQAAQAMLAQANQQPQSILQLLQ